MFLDGQKDGISEKIKKSSQKAWDWLQDNQLEIKNRVLNAGLSDQAESYMEPLGLGYAERRQRGVLDNLLLLDTDVLASARELMRRARGYYKTQAWLSLSPLFWLEMLIFLPREIIKLAGFNNSSKLFQISVKLIQVIYWIISVVYTFKLLSQK